jgi:two-component system chemotaxis response regulator CheB
MAAAKRIRVLIVDDSAFVRKALTQILGSDPEIDVVGTAMDPVFARQQIAALKPDVLTLDLDMPRMDGMTFLEALMSETPMPVVIVSSITERSAQASVQALELGAIDCVAKPRLDVTGQIGAIGAELIAKVKAAAGARPTPGRMRMTTAHTVAGQSVLPPSHSVIVIGGSTGGAAAIVNMLRTLPADAPGIVIVQHMPAGFTKTFAERCDQVSPMSVKEAKTGDRVLRGHVLVAPGSQHARLLRNGSTLILTLSADPPVNNVRPSIDVLFESVAEAAGPSAVGVILTGMGRDGVAGLKRMRDAGAPTIAQDEATSTVFGMPKEAIAAGAVGEVLPAGAIAARMLQLANSIELANYA